jgi:hypothetical protein
MTRSISTLALAAGLGLMLTGQMAKADPFPNYHLLQTIPVPSSATDWDYVTFDPGTKQLFIGHADDGIEVFDTANGFKMTKIPNTTPSGGVILAPEFGLGIAHIDTGGFTVFKLSDLSVVKTVKVDDAPEGFDSAGYDPATHQVIATDTTTTPEGGQTIPVYSVPSFNKVGSFVIMDDDAEHPVADGQGNMYIVGQKTSKIFRVDMRTLTVTATYPAGCVQPTGLAVDSANHRLFIGCRGKIDNPKFVVMNADNGDIVFSAPISPDNDGVEFNPKNGNIFVANGVGSTMYVFHEDSADKYKLAEIVGTSSYEKTLAIDVDGNYVYTIAAEGVVDPSKHIKPKNSHYYANVWEPNSFNIRQYGQ